MNVVLIEDSRQQIGKHNNIRLYCKRHGIEIIRKKLEVGDYAFPNGKISIDTKQDLMELCKDVMSNDHRRFRAECQRAMEMGIKLIVLIEEVPPFSQVDLWEVPRWQSSNEYHRFGDPMTLVDPAVFAKALQTMTERYGVQFRFCHRKQTPVKVMKYLKGELK
jgi:hypothetical protein